MACVPAAELGQRQVGRQQRVQPAGELEVQVPELAPGGFAEGAAHQGMGRHVLDDLGQRGGDVNLAFLAQQIQPALDFLVHDLDVADHLVALEGRVQDRALLVVGLGGGGEGHVPEHGAQEAVGLAHVEALVGLVEEDLVVLRANQDGGRLRAKLDGEDRAEQLVAALEEALAIVLEFQGITQQGEARHDRRGGFHGKLLLKLRYVAISKNL